MQKEELRTSSIKYEDRPSFIKALLELVKSAERDSKPLVVIDSIEAVENVVKAPLVEDLVKISEELDLYLLLVSERADLSESDFFVDGIIELRRDISEGATIRKAIIRKMRGVEIKQPEYLFTLRDGKFGIFPLFSFRAPEETRLFEAIEDPSERLFSSGSRELDEIFGGGFPKGSSILLELSEGVTREMYYQIVSVFALNFLRNGRRVFAIHPLGVDREEIRENFIYPYVEEGERELLADSWEELRDDFRGEIKRILTEGEFQEALHITGGDTLRSLFKEEVDEFLSLENEVIKRNKGLALRIAKHGFPLVREFSNLSDIHVKMENICNVPTIRGLRPKTQYYGMTLSFSEGYPQLGFTQIE
ncbi:MAG: gas vesicle operon resressor [Archaeoglobi archaeon]|nr:gas vesicle operon resressor [Archaeoglobi archaeon]